MSDVSVKLGATYQNTAVKELIQDVRDSQAAIERLVQNFKDLGASEEEAAVGMRRVGTDSSQTRMALDEVYGSTEKSSGGMGNMNSSARALRVGIAGLVADMALATIASGEQLPQGLREGAKGLQTVTDLAVAGAFAFGPMGALIGGIAGSFVALGSAAMTVDPEISALNNSLDGLGKKDATITTLSNVLGVTYAEAAAMVEAAKHNSEFATKLDAVARSAEPVPVLVAAVSASVDTLGISIGKIPDVGEGLNTFLRNSVSELVYYGTILQDVIKAIEAPYQFTSTADILADANRKATAALKEYDDKVKGVSADVGTLKTLTAEAGAINDQYDPTIKKIESSLQSLARTLRDDVAQQMLEMVRLQNQVTSDTENAALQLAHIAQTRTDAIFQADQSLHDREIADAYQYASKLEQINEEIARQHQALVDRINDIDFQSQQSRQSLDFNLKEALEKAKTQREREEIMERYRFEVGQLDQKTAHEKSDAQRSYDEAKQAAAEKRALADEEYKHQLELDQRTYSEQVALAKKRYDEEKNALKERYQLEIENINKSLAAFLIAEDLKIQAMQNEIRVERGQATLPYTVNPPDPALLEQLTKYEQQNQPKFDTGGTVPGPRGAPSLIMAHGGETVLRMGERGGGAKEASPQIVNVHVEPMVQPVVHSMLAQFVQGHVFKQGVQVILNDESFS